MCFVSKLVVEKLERETRPLYRYRWLGDKSNVPGDLPDSKNYDEMLGDKYSEASENQIFLRV